MTRVNLLQPRLPSQEILSRRRVRAAYGGVVVLVGVSVLALLGIMVSRFMLQERLQSVENQLAAEATMAKEAAALEKAIREAEERAELVSQLPQAEERLAALVSAVDGARPAGCTIRRITVDADGSLFITGTASSHQTVAHFVDQLRNLPGLADVTFQESAMAQKGEGISFDLRGAVAQPQAETSEGGDQA